ncbi:hypothetical protein OUZ56_011345 [Daphnia magna]|uniref:SAM domain-containing protein n=1 Tax=Daphnia magna TaxID=35525 RepID=A0ABQ9Z143_9CRUS|nr:hypothetical protein OUZ56_011345 [Daphnia magna]
MDRCLDEMKAWSVNDVEIFLKTKGFSNDVTDIMRGNEIDGESLLLLNNTEVASMGFKIGTAAKFRKLLEILRSDVSAQKGVNLQNEIETVGLSLRSEFQSTSDFAKEQESTETVELNLFEILKSEKKGKEIVANYISRNKDFITHEERIEVVNIICSHMIAVNPLKHFPSTTLKHLYADAIVQSFPCLGTRVKDIDGTLRLNHDVEWIKVHVCSGSNRAKIFEYMENTFEFRDRESTFRFTSASEILMEYPRLADVDEGSLEMIIFHFIFCRIFIINTRTCMMHSNFASSRDCMNSLILCLQLLPAVFNVKKASFDSKVDRLFHFVKQNALISEAVEAKDVIHHKQPYLIVVGSLEHPLSFNLVVDQTLIPLVRELCYKISPSNQEFANMLDNIALKNIYGEADAAQKLLSPFKNPTSRLLLELRR